MKKKFYINGFTLIELLVVISVIGVLSSVVLSSLGEARDRARNAKSLSDANEIQKLIQIAHLNSNQTTYGFTSTINGSNNFGDTCNFVGDVNNSSCLSKAVDFYTALYTAAGVPNPHSLGYFADSWGNPYIIDVNDGEPPYTACTREDTIYTTEGSDTFTWSLDILKSVVSLNC